MKLNKILLVSIFLSHYCSIMSMEQARQPKMTSRPLGREKVLSHPLMKEPGKVSQAGIESQDFIDPQPNDSNQNPVASSFTKQVPIRRQVDLGRQAQAKQQDGVPVDPRDDAGWQLFDENDFRWNKNKTEPVDLMTVKKQLELQNSSVENITAEQPNLSPRAQRITAFKKQVQQKPLKQDQDIEEPIQEQSIQVGQKKIIQAEFDLSKNVLEKVIEQQLNLDPTHQTFYTKTRNNFYKKYIASKDSPEQTQIDLANANEMNDRARNLPSAGRQIIVDVWADIKLQESTSRWSTVKKGYAQVKRTLALKTKKQTEAEYQDAVTEKIIQSGVDSIFGVHKYSADSNAKLSPEALSDLNTEIKKNQNILFKRDGKSYSEVQRQQAIANIKDLGINKVTSGIAKFKTIIESDGTYNSEISSDGLTSQTVFDPAGKAKSRTLSVLNEENRMIKFKTEFDVTQNKVLTKVLNKEDQPILDKEGNPTVLTPNGANQVDQWQASHLACVVAKSTLKAVLYGIKMTPYVAYWALTTPHNIKSIVIMLGIEVSKTSVFTVVKAASLGAGFKYSDPVVSSLTNRVGTFLSGSNRGWMSAERGRVFKRGSDTSNWINKMRGKEEETMNPDEEYYTCLSLVDDMGGQLRPQENAYLYGPMSFDPFGSNSLASRVKPAFSTEPVISPLHAAGKI